MPWRSLEPVQSLPPDAVTQRISVLGRTGSGKSHTAGVIVEEVLEHRQHTVILDPKGDFWGLRSSADGKQEGYSIVVFGGEHGDIPLDPASGALVADLIIKEGISAVLDLSLFESKAEENRFATDFADRLYRKNGIPLMLVIDEADQSCLSGDTQLLTKHGWREWHQIRVGDPAVAFNPMTGEYQYEAVETISCAKYSDHMVNLKTRRLDCLVTPNHQVLGRCVQRAKGRYGKVYPWRFHRAIGLPTETFIPMGGAPCGSGVPGLSLTMARVLGWVITDGAFHDRQVRNRRVVLDQALTTTKLGRRTACTMSKILKQIPGVVRRVRVRPDHEIVGTLVKSSRSYTWYFGGSSSDEVIRWLGEEVHRIPRNLIENCSKEQLEQLYLGLVEGDGTAPVGFGRWTGFFPGLERGLADDFQEIALRLGICTSVSEFTPPGYNLSFIVNIASMSGNQYLRRIGRKHYSGTVWNITVTSGAFVARRKGKVFVTGGLPKVTHRATIEPLSLRMFQGKKSTRKTCRVFTLSEVKGTRLRMKEVLSQAPGVSAPGKATRTPGMTPSPIRNNSVVHTDHPKIKP